MSALASSAAGQNVSHESAEWLSGVTTSGLSLTEWDGTRSFRWSDGDARVSIPVDPDAPPSELSVSITTTGGLEKSLGISVDDCALFDAVIEGPWSRTFSLSACGVASQRMEVSIRSTTHVPGNGDARELGVAVGSVEITTSAID
jgi:hypothetical protein